MSTTPSHKHPGKMTNSPIDGPWSSCTVTLTVTCISSRRRPYLLFTRDSM